MPVPEVTLAKDVGLLLLPYWPALLGQQAAPQGDAAYAKAQGLWQQLKDRPQVLIAAQDLLTDLGHVEKQGTLRFRVKNALEADPALAETVRALL